jgi:hypothetical protein
VSWQQEFDRKHVVVSHEREEIHNYTRASSREIRCRAHRRQSHSQRAGLSYLAAIGVEAECRSLAASLAAQRWQSNVPGVPRCCPLPLWDALGEAPIYMTKGHQQGVSLRSSAHLVLLRLTFMDSEHPCGNVAEAHGSRTHPPHPEDAEQRF